MRRSLVVVAVVSSATALSCACRQAAEGPAIPAAAPAAPAAAGEASKGPPNDPARVPREYLVTAAAGSGEAALREVYGRLGITGVEALGNAVFRVTFSEDPGLASLEELARKDGRIRAVQPNFVYKAN